MARPVERIALQRAYIVLARLDGLSVAAVPEKLGTTSKPVSTWAKRFGKEGLAGLEARPMDQARLTTTRSPPSSSTRSSSREREDIAVQCPGTRAG